MTWKGKKPLLIAVLLLLLSATTALAQIKVHRGQVAEISGTVVDELGNPVAGATVELLDGSTVIDTTTTGSSGSFTLRWNVPASEALGPKTLTVHVPAQPSLYVEESSVNVQVDVWDGTEIQLDQLPSKIHRGDTVTISGKLRMSANGNPVAGAQLKLVKGGTVVVSSTTSPDGSFSMTFTVPMQWERGPITLTVGYDGDSSKYLDASQGSGSTALWIRPTIRVTATKGG